jgi:hypothetical protein
MDTAFKVNAMCIDYTESTLICGSNSGELLLVDTENLTLRGSAQGNVGSIYAAAAHPGRPLAATMGMDCAVCLWDIERPSAPRLLSRLNMRKVSPWNDMEVTHVHPSHSQALCFHPELPVIATRSGNSGVVELDFGSGELELLHCTRFHGREDVTTVRYVLNGRKLASGGNGSIVLSEEGLVINHWRVALSNVHWFEPLERDIYLIASDDRRVLRFDFRQGEVLTTGPYVTRDDLEHVTFNRASRRAYVVGFDRNVYEIDTQTCASLGIAYAAPYKMRWIKTLQRQPDVAFLQCFDGGVYKVDLNQKRAVAAMRRTPPAVWTACELDAGRIALTGEGDEIVTVRYATAPDARHPIAIRQTVTSKGNSDGITKRMICDDEGSLWLGQSTGTLICVQRDEPRVASNFDSAIRDLASNRRGDRILVCLESGAFHSVDRTSGTALASWQSPGKQPLWALAAHPREDRVAVGERSGKVMLLDASTAEVMHVGPPSERIKRARWLDADTLLYNFLDSMHRYDMRLDKVTPYVDPCGNTIEDFIWNETFGYFLFITYNTDIVLCDLATGERIHTGSDQGDFSKGLMWVKALDPAAYPLDFITFGRSGTAHIYRIHDDKIVALGPLSPQLLRQCYRVNGLTLDQPWLVGASHDASASATVQAS